MARRLPAASLYLLLLAAAAAAQEVPAVVANMAPSERREGWATLVVPADALPRPPVRFLPHGWPAYYGEAWGPRARLVHVRHGRLAPLEHAVGRLATAAAGDVAPAQPAGPTVADSAAAAPTAVRGLLPEVVVRVGQGEGRWLPEPLRVVEGAVPGTQRVVLEAHGRVPGTMLAARAWLYVMPAHPVVEVELLLANSDPRSPEFVQQVDEVRLETAAQVWPVMDWHVRRGGGPTAAVPGGLSTPLLGRTWLGHGQALAWRGRLLLWRAVDESEAALLYAEQRGPVVAQALPAAWAGRWGPWGALPALHPSEATDGRGHGRTALWALWRRYAAEYRVPGDHPAGPVWTEPHWTVGWIPGGTGDKQDFGATKLAPALSPRDGGPAHLWELGLSAVYEALRPSYYYEADGNPLRIEDHPNLVFWGLSVHWHSGVSPDRLGKRDGPGDDVNSVYAKDWAHMSSNNLAGFGLISGSHLGRHLLFQEGQGWLLGSRVDRGLGEARGVGRSTQAVSWGWLTTGDARIPARIRERFARAHGDYLARAGDAVAPLGLYDPDGRKLDGKYPFWMPWQEAEALRGLDAGYQVAYVLDQARVDLGKAEARRMLTSISRTLVAKGWWLHLGRWTTGDAIRYDGGRDLPESAYGDESQVSPHWPGTAYDEWGSGAVAVARRWLVEAGDAALVEKCDQILAALDARYHSGDEPSGFTRYSEWRAAR